MPKPENEKPRRDPYTEVGNVEEPHVSKRQGDESAVSPRKGVTESGTHRASVLFTSFKRSGWAALLLTSYRSVL